jgi:hypothetical protein
VTASLPVDVQRVFERFLTTELTTLDEHGHPITWPVTPYYSAGAPCIDVTTGLGYPKKANDARRNPRVALLFSDSTGSGLDPAPMVLVQGTADVDDRDLDANRERYARESADKIPAVQRSQPPAFLRRFFSWYYTRIYVHVRPERVYVWADGDVATEPQLYDCHMEEVRSGHDEEPDVPHETPTGGAPVWDVRLDELGRRYAHAVLSFLAPDGFPFSARVPVTVDRDARLIRIDRVPVGAPLQPGISCLAAHEHDEDFSWQRNFHVRGDLVEADGGWAIAPHKLVGGFEVPPGGMLAQVRENYGKMRRFRRRARTELERRSA